MRGSVAFRSKIQAGIVSASVAANFLITAIFWRKICSRSWGVDSLPPKGISQTNCEQSAVTTARAKKFDGLTNLILEHERLALKTQGAVFEGFRNLLRQFLHHIIQDRIK